jgi:TolB-like protein/class 3 adenylate cyclase/rhodanese-related sulfurtransferase/Flp pilus assembly protein TadD
MAKDRLSGKLAVILHADVAGSTAMVQQDKELAHERIQDTFQRFSDTIEKYQGHVVELRGDALLAEFERASDAVSAALSFQSDNAYYLSRLKDDLRPTVRIGIAMGEVVIADSTVTGAGVVQAQRVEQLADSGGVCITAAINESLSKRMPFNLENLGEQVLKGFDDPVRVYRVELSANQSVPAPQQDSQNEAPPKKPNLIVASILIALAVGGGIYYWFEARVPQEQPASVERMVFPLPDKPSIAILPFSNLSDDKQQEYFADGMTEDLITDISKISGLFVIARNSVFTYKGKAVKVRQVAEELGVRYVMEGSVRRVGNQVRVNAQLIDATTGGHVWAERYDGSLDDVFTIQDKITRNIVTALAVALVDQEQNNLVQVKTNNPKAYDAYLQGWSYYKLQTPTSLVQAIPFFEQALRADPGYSQAHAALASLYWNAYKNNWAFDLGILSFTASSKASEHLKEALKVPTPMAHALNSKILAALGYYEDAFMEAKKGLVLDPNDAIALEGLANIEILVERPAKAVNTIHKAMRLDPYYPPTYLITLGRAQFALENFDDATATFKRAVKRNIENDLPLIYLAASYGHMGWVSDGDAAIEVANKLRNEAGMIDVSLRDLPYHRESDFSRFGGNLEQERVRAGLAVLPALSWTFLLTSQGTGMYISHAFRPPAFEVEGAVKIDVVTAKSMYDRGSTFIDVRIDYSPSEGRITGAFHLPESRSADPSKPSLHEKTLMEIVDKTDEVVFYCDEATCYHSAFASAKAVAWGYRHVLYFAEGLQSWKDAGYPVEQ